MMELMVGEIFLKALVLCGILFLVARHEADFDFKKVALVTCGITLGILAVEAFVDPRIKELLASRFEYPVPEIVSGSVTLLLATAFTAFMVIRFCWVGIWKGIVVAIVFMAFSIGLSMAGAYVAAKINESVEEAGGSKMEEANKEAVQMFQEMMEQSSAEMMRQAQVESGMPMPAVPGTNTGTAHIPPASEPASPAENPAPPPAVETPPPPIDELPAFARTPEWQAAQAKIKVSAVLVERDGSNVAIVNGDVLGIGDVLTVEVKKKIYRFKMAEITTDWVAWDPVAEAEPE